MKKINRRDFIHTSIGIGSVAAAGRFFSNCDSPAGETADTNPWDGYTGDGDYARANGNTWDVAQAAHRVRDNAIDFDQAGAIDEEYDLVVVGAGFSGLGAAHEFSKSSGSGTCLIIDNHEIFGGEAKQNEFEIDGHRLVAPQGSNGFLVPGKQSPFGKLWYDVGMPSEYEFASLDGPIRIAKEHFGPMYYTEQRASVGYFFDTSGECVVDPWKNELKDCKWPDDIKNQLLSLRHNLETPHPREGFEQWLDSITYKEFIVDHLKLDPAVTKFVDPILAISAFGLGSDVISAYAAYTLSLPGVNAFDGGNHYEDLDMYSFPGGNTAIARHIVKKLIPNSINGNTFGEILKSSVNFESLDRSGHKVRMRLGTTAVEVASLSAADDSDVKVTYLRNGKLESVVARNVIMATGAWVSRRVCKKLPEHLLSAMAEFNHSPVLVANVALSNWRFMEKLGISAARWFDGFGFFASIRRPMIVDGKSEPFHPDKPIVLTLYIPIYYPGEDLKAQNVKGRTEMFTTSSATYEKMIIEKLNELFHLTGFNADRDIRGIILNRWGHAFVSPQPGFYFPESGESPSNIIRKGYGSIQFAHSELWGHQNWAGASIEGIRAAQTALARMG